MADTAEAQADPEEIIVIPSDVPLVKLSPPGTPSGIIEGQSNMSDQRLDPNSAIQQSGPISGQPKKTTGIAFSGGGIRSAAFCSGALRKMLQDDVPLEYLSCVSGGGYTGAAFLDWKTRRSEDPELKKKSDKELHKMFFETMRKNAGYMCDWQRPCYGICHSVLFLFLLIVVVFILPCILWLPYAFPIAVVVDVLFGGILRENSTCPQSVNVGTGTSFLILELYDNCQPPARRMALFIITFSSWIVFFILSRIYCLNVETLKKCFFRCRNPFRLLSIISGLLFAFTFFPWLAHDFLWPLRTWIKVVVLLICLVIPFFFPIVRNVAGIFLFFYAYTIIVSWKVFKTELFGALPYSDDVFYPFLMGCAIAIFLFPLIGPLHQSLFNIYYRYRLSKMFFREPARCRWQDFFPACGRPVNIITNAMKGKGFTLINDTEGELTLQDIESVSPKFISNITVNNWQMDSDANSSHQLMSFSSEGIKVIGTDVEEPPDFSERFKPSHMRLSAAMAISGAAVSFDMGSYETGLDMVLDLLNLLGIGMGDEMASDQCACGEAHSSTYGKIRQYVLPTLAEICCGLPLLAVPFLYWLGNNKDWVEYLVLVHIVIVLVLTGIAFVRTGSPEPGMWQRFIRWWIRHHFFVRFIRGFVSIDNVGTHPPPVLRLSDGGHFENLALLPLLDKRREKIVIFDGSCNPGDEKYAESLFTALKLAREKLHCSFEGMDGRDINEDIRVNFLKIKSKKRPRSYKFKVHYYDKDKKTGEGDILFVSPRHPSESIPLAAPRPPSESTPLTDEPKPWKDVDAELVDLDEKLWGKSPELTEREADRLTFCCCNRCHSDNSCCHCISNCLLGKFPHHITGNQFFTPDTFSAYHREGYAACIEADVAGFFKEESTQDAETQTAF